MSYEDLVQFYKDNKHLFSKEQREAIEKALKTEEEQSQSERKRTTDTEKQTKSVSTRKGAQTSVNTTVGIGGNYGLVKAGVNWNSSVYYSKEQNETKEKSTSHSKEQEEASRNAVVNTIASALANVLATQNLQATGKTLSETFKNSKEFAEALQAAEKYREAEALESALSINALPLIVQRVADREFSQYGIFRYSMAMSSLIAAIHKGDVETIKKFTKELDELRNHPFLGSNILTKGENLQKQVEEGLEKQHQNLSSQSERFSPGKHPPILWPWNNGFVKENPPNLPPPKGPKIP
jgi:hypothetical protein